MGSWWNSYGWYSAILYWRLWLRLYICSSSLKPKVWKCPSTLTKYTTTRGYFKLKGYGQLAMYFYLWHFRSFCLLGVTRNGRSWTRRPALWDWCVLTCLIVLISLFFYTLTFDAQVHDVMLDYNLWDFANELQFWHYKIQPNGVKYQMVKFIPFG